MKKTITVRISTSGDVQVEADGFAGDECIAATKELEAALGQAQGRTRKPGVALAHGVKLPAKR